MTSKSGNITTFATMNRHGLDALQQQVFVDSVNILFLFGKYQHLQRTHNYYLFIIKCSVGRHNHHDPVC